MREKAYPFTHEGLQSALQHKDYIETVKETIENHPEVFPVALLLILSVSVLLVSPLATGVAYKGSVDNSIIAFKYLGGF